MKGLDLLAKKADIHARRQAKVVNLETGCGLRFLKPSETCISFELDTLRSKSSLDLQFLIYEAQIAAQAGVDGLHNALTR